MLTDPHGIGTHYEVRYTYARECSPLEGETASRHDSAASAAEAATALEGPWRAVLAFEHGEVRHLTAEENAEVQNVYAERGEAIEWAAEREES